MVLKTEPERRGFQRPPRGQAGLHVEYQKSTFDRYYCIKSFSHLKTLENGSEISFLYYYNGAQKHEGFGGLEKACSRAKTYVILTSLNYVHFYASYC